MNRLLDIGQNFVMPCRGWMVRFLVTAAIGFYSGTGIAGAQTIQGWQPSIRANSSELPKAVPAAAPPVSMVNAAPDASAADPGPPVQPQKPPSDRQAEEKQQNESQEGPSGQSSPQERTSGSLAEQYCRVAVDSAVAAKLAEERAKAEALRAEIEAKIALLEKASAEQQKWMQLRKEFQNKATDNLVDVYVQMDAEAAAQRLTAVDEQIAAAILIKLPAKAASAIIGEMPLEVAGRLTTYMAGSAEVKAASAKPGAAK